MARLKLRVGSPLTAAATKVGSRRFDCYWTGALIQTVASVVTSLWPRPRS